MARAKAKRTEQGADLCCPSLIDAPLDEAEAAELGRVLAALGDPVRLRLLSLVASQTEVCSCDLERPLGKSQPTISHHTKVLAEAGLLDRREARPLGVVAGRRGTPRRYPQNARRLSRVSQSGEPASA